MNKEWLDGLKAGDDVVVIAQYNAMSICKVVRRTATQILVAIGKNFAGEDIIGRYRNDSGCSVGSDAWSGSNIYELTIELRNEIESKRIKTRILNALSKITIPETLEQRKELYAAIKALPCQAVAK
jgi:hypothetical protein